MKKKALLSSILTIALCLSLIAGSTFALFTSESKVNVAVTAGKVDVVATIEDLKLYSPKAIGETGTITDATNAADETFANGGTATLEGNKLTLTSITPGDKVTFNVKITNNSNVAVQYRNIVEKIVDDGLWAGLKVTIDKAEYMGETKKSDWAVLNVGSDVITVPVEIELPAAAGNTYQGKTCELVYTVEAVQGNAQMPDEWDGTNTTAPTIDNENVYHITNAAEFVYVMNATNTGVGNVYNGKTISLDTDIDLGGATVSGFGDTARHWSGTFNGNGHTVSNFTVNRDGKDYGGLFNYVYDGSTIKDLTVKNATIIAEAWVGAVTGSNYNGGIVENCHAINCTVIGEKKVGAVVGYNQASTVKNCSATDCAVYCEVSEDTESAGIKPQAGEVVGFSIKDGAKYDEGIIDCTSENVTVTYDYLYLETNNATKLATALKSEHKSINVTLTDDVYVEISLLNPQIGGSGEYRLGGSNTEQINIDLNGHKLTLGSSYMSALGANNSEAVINVKNGSFNSTNTGTWNIYDLMFANCTWNFEKVVFDKAVAIYTGATATMKNVTINDNNDVYALWITADAKDVTLDNVTINCPNGRGIAIKDQYRVNNTNKVVLNISNSKIVSAKKAAILVSSNGGATITANNVDISNVSADQTNIVWKDNGTSTENGFNYSNADVTINGSQAVVEP